MSIIWEAVEIIFWMLLFSKRIKKSKTHELSKRDYEFVEVWLESKSCKNIFLEKQKVNVIGIFYWPI